MVRQATRIDDLGVRGGVEVGRDAVRALADDDVAADDERAETDHPSRATLAVARSTARSSQLCASLMPAIVPPVRPSGRDRDWSPSRESGGGTPRARWCGGPVTRPGQDWSSPDDPSSAEAAPHVADEATVVVRREHGGEDGRRLGGEGGTRAVEPPEVRPHRADRATEDVARLLSHLRVVSTSGPARSRIAPRGRR